MPDIRDILLIHFTEYDVSPETLYILGSYPRRTAKLPPSASLAKSTYLLLEAASQRGSQKATILKAYHFLGDLSASKHPRYKNYIYRLELFAKEQDRQCMTVLAMLQRQTGNIEKAQRLLENVLHWSPQPYTPSPRGKNVPMSLKLIRDYFYATMDELNGRVQNQQMFFRQVFGEVQDVFAGVSEAMYTLGLIYLKQIDGSSPRSVKSTQYYTEAYTLFVMAHTWTHDLRSLRQLLRLSAKEMPSRVHLAEQAALHAMPEAWNCLAETNVGGTQYDLHTSKGAASSARTSVVPQDRVRMMEEWKELAKYHNDHAWS